jgi:hypothetical protein
MEIDKKINLFGLLESYQSLETLNDLKDLIPFYLFKKNSRQKIWFIADSRQEIKNVDGDQNLHCKGITKQDSGEQL